MTLEQLAGRLLWCGWGDSPDPASRSYNHHLRCLVEDLQAGGIILFTRNLGPAEEIASLTAEIRQHAETPLLIGMDQEGGRVCRLPLPGLTFPGAMALGTLDDPDVTREVSRAIGEQLAALGIGVDFAPVLDVNNNPGNPVIGVRSFGDDPERVARHGVAAVAGFREAGVLPVVKHFPGHGDTGADSHLELPVQPAGRERLDAVELAPFRAALQAGAPAVMTAHIHFPALDPGLPATLSRAVLTGVLREEFGFDGLIVTDCLEMGGITDHWGPEEAAVLALQAGADMLLVCHTWETQTRMRDAVCAAVRSGRLAEERLWESALRVTRARELSGAGHDGPPNPALVSAERYRDLEARVAEACLTPFGGSGAGVKAGWTRDRPVMVSGAAGMAPLLAEALAREGFRAEAAPWQGMARETLPEAVQLLWVVLPDDPFPGGLTPEPVSRFLAEHPKTVVVAAREPYCLASYPETALRLAAWGGQPPHLRAVARWLAGYNKKG